jgi:small-conductance mechanosensitive channel
LLLVHLGVAIWGIFLSAGGALAQSQPATDTEALTTAIQEARDAGMSVIILDSSGNLVASGARATPATAPEEETASKGSSLMRAQSRMSEFNETLSTRLEALPVSINEVVYILRATSPDGQISTYVYVLVTQLGLFVISFVIVHLVFNLRIAKRLVVSRVKENPQGYSEKMPFLVFRFLMGVASTLITLTVMVMLSIAIWGTAEDMSIDFTVTAILVTLFSVRAVSDLWRMILSPFLSQYRIPNFSDREAKRLYRWLSIVTTFDISALMFSTWIADFGLNYNVYAIMYGVLSLIGALGAVLLVLFNWPAISRAIRNGRSADEVGWVTRVVSYAWAPAVLVYVAFSWLELSYNLVMERPASVPLIIASYGILMSIIVVYGVINYAIERYFDRSREVTRMRSEHEAQEAAEGEILPNRKRHDIRTYEDLARRVAGILALVAGTQAALEIWVPDTQLLEDSLADKALDIAVIIFIGYIIFHFFRIWIDSKIDEETVDEEAGELGDEGGANSATRLGTLLPLFRGAILSVVVISIALIVLLELGINVSPLFAGAGVDGLAIGFGAQTLVRDIFSRAFFLIDDAFRKGEYIDIGDVKGTVEKISVRSFQLRHHLGALNTIPFGEIRVLTSYSRDWVIMKLPLRVTYDTDVEKVRKLIKKLGQQLLDDPVIGENFIQPLKSQGVIEMQDSAMIIRVKFMTKPGDQWLVRKKVYEEIRALFAKEGIRFAHREVTVRLADGNPDELTPQQREGLTGAVQAAIDEDLMDINEGDDR